MTVSPGVGLVLMILRTVRQGHHDADQVTADSSQDRADRVLGELGESSETARLAQILRSLTPTRAVPLTSVVYEKGRVSDRRWSGVAQRVEGFEVAHGDPSSA